MRILHVITSLNPADGGPPRIAVRLAAAQAGAGHSVAMLFYDFPPARAQIEEEFQTLPGANLIARHVLLPGNKLDRIFGGSARAKLSTLIGQFDFVHIHNVWDTICRIAASVSLKHNVPYTFLVNGMLDPWSLSQKAMKKKIAMAISFRKLLNGAAFLHLGNDEERVLIEPLQLKCPSEIIPNGVFIEEMNPLPAPGLFFAEHPELNGQRYILFLSRLHYKKGLDYLAEAFAKIATAFTDVHLVVAGPDGGAKAGFESAIASVGLTERVHLVGTLWQKEKYAALVDSACFCLPSRQEGFSMAILEALACGVPVVITHPCHFDEVGAVGAGEVTELNAVAVAEGLRKILSNGQSKSRIGAAGRALVQTKYTWPKIGEAAVRTYKKYLNR